MIKSFRCRKTQKIFHRDFSRKFPRSVQKIAMRKLWMLDAAISIGDLRTLPSNHLGKLHGKKNGQYSIRINKQWRICFKWNRGDAQNVEIVDYH